MPSDNYANVADSPSFYSVAIPGTEEEGYTSVRRNPRYEEILSASYFVDIKSSWDIFQNGLKINPDAPCIGKREVLPDGTFGEYKFKSYSEVEHMSKVVGSSLLNIGIITEQSSGHDNIEPCRIVGLFLPSCEEWLLCEQGCYAYGFTLVPIYHTFGINPIRFILENTRAFAQFNNKSCRARIIVLYITYRTSNMRLNTIVLINTEEIPEEIINCGINVNFMLWSTFIQFGEKNIQPINPGPLNSLNSISFTSGTTGLPKGVMITHKNLVDSVIVTIHSAVRVDAFPKNAFECHISYLPMAHLFEKTFLHAVYYNGGKIGLNSGDVKMILNDIQTLKPSFFVSVPRLFQRIHDKILAGVSEKCSPIRALFYHALQTKIKKIKKSGIYTHYLYDKLIFNKIQELLGGNVSWMFIGSSSISPLIIDRIKALFGKPFIYGYGLTESTACGFIQAIGDTQSNHCGGPIATHQFRIKSVPNLSYFADAKPPRGELLLRGTNITPGYFRLKEETDNVIIDGWLHTGDIVELQENGSIKIIDRIKQLFKLSQGEYIAPEYIESIINSSPYVAQSFVCGKSDEPFPVAIIVPNEGHLRVWSKSNNLDKLNFDDLCKTEALHDLIKEDLNKLFVSNQLKGYESVKEIYLESNLFTIENELLTVTSKLRRNNAMRHYKNEIDEMYNKLKTR